MPRIIELLRNFKKKKSRNQIRLSSLPWLQGCPEENFHPIGTHVLYSTLLSFLLSLALIIFYTLTFFRLFLAVLGLCCCVWAFSSGSGWRLFFVAACGLLIMVASFIAEHSLLAHGLQYAAQGLSSCRVLPQLLHCMWDLSQTNDLTHVSSIGRWILNHWTTGETLFSFFNCLSLYERREL